MSEPSSQDFKYGTLEYYALRVVELEKERNLANDHAVYYQTELETAHTLLGRVTHQLAERWDSVRLTKYYPTDNLHGKRSLRNPKGE